MQACVPDPPACPRARRPSAAFPHLTQSRPPASCVRWCASTARQARADLAKRTPAAAVRRARGTAAGQGRRRRSRSSDGARGCGLQRRKAPAKKNERKAPATALISYGEIRSAALARRSCGARSASPAGRSASSTSAGATRPCCSCCGACCAKRGRWRRRKGMTALADLHSPPWCKVVNIRKARRDIATKQPRHENTKRQQPVRASISFPPEVYQALEDLASRKECRSRGSCATPRKRT